MAAPFEIELTRGVAAPSEARRCLQEHYQSELARGELDTAKLLVSELVSNAVLHGRGTITLRTSLDENRLLVEVMDQGSGFERTLERRDFEQIGGRGLEIVEADASCWGVHEGTTHVWFELERAGPRLGGDSKPEL